MRICVIEGHLGVDVIARSEQHPHVFVWVNAHTKEVQHCRQVTAVDTAMLAQIQVCAMLPSEGLPSATSVSLKAMGNFEHTPQPPKKMWSLALYAERVSACEYPVFCKQTSRLTRHDMERGMVNVMGSVHRKCFTLH